MNRSNRLAMSVFIALWCAVYPFAFASDLAADARVMLAKEDTAYLAETAATFFYQHFGDDRLTELLRAVWNRDQTKYPDLAWRSLSDDEVRLRFAGLWAQWIRETQKDKSEISKIREYVLPFRKHSNPRFRLAAVAFTVGDTDKDVEGLIHIVLTDDRLIASTAVYSIIDIQGKRAKETLLKIKDQVNSSHVRKVIEDALKKLNEGAIPLK